MKKILYHFLIAGIAASAFFACVDTHDTLPYVDPNTQYKQDQENSQILEEGTFIAEKFSSSLGGCVSVSDNTTVNYIIDYSSAKVTGNINSAKNAATVYLVSPTVDLSSAESAYYTFEHIIAYETGDLLQDEQFLVSLDYNGDPAKATWTQLPVSAVLNTGKPASWSEFVSTAFNLPQEYLKSSVTFAFKYTSTTSCAATWEIKNFSVKTGTVTETVPYENPKVQETSPEEPLTVTEALTAATSATAKSYVTGYIVGFVDGQKLAEGSVFSAENCKVESNILIAASATEKDVKNCLPVQLPANTKHRTALNLSSNKDVLGKQVVLGGYIQSYFGANGLKSLFYSALEGVVIDAPAESTGFDGNDNTTELTETINLSFKESGLDKFSIYNFAKAEDLGHVWTNSSQYGMVAKGSAAENKAWLISPRVDVSKCEKIEFTFNHAANNFPEAEGVDKKCAVYVSKDYAGGDPSKATWTKLDLEKWSSNWTWVENTFDLTEYKSDNIHIAFEYTSASQDGEKIGSFEIDNVYLGSTREAETPVKGYDGESTLKTAQIPFAYDFQTEKKLGDFLVYDVKRLDSKNKHIWTADTKYGAKAVAATEAESWFISPKFALETGKEYELKFTNSYLNAAKPGDVFKAYVLQNLADDVLTAEKEALTMEFGAAKESKETTLDISKYAGKTVVIAFQYTASEEEKGTFEIFKFSLNEIVKNEEPVSGLDETAGISDFSVYDVKKFASADEHIWKSSTEGITAKATKAAESWLISSKLTLSADKQAKLTFTAFTDKAADDAKKVYKAYIFEDYNGGNPSEVTGTAIQLALAKGSNKANEIDLSNYAGKNISIAFQYTSSADDQGTFRIKDFKIEETAPEVPVKGFDGTSTITEVATADLPYNYNFKEQKQLGNFLVYDISHYKETEEHIWQGDTKYGAKAVSKKESESWLISPKFTLESGNEYELSITNSYVTATNPAQVYSTYISKDYNGDPETATWEKLSMEFAAEKASKTNTYSLNDYAGESVVISIRYTSTETEKGTLEIFDFSLSKIVPNENPVSGYNGNNELKTGTLPFTQNFKTAMGDFLVYDAKRYASKDEQIWKQTQYGATAVAKAESESWLISPKFTLESGKEYTLKFTNYYKDLESEPQNVYQAVVSEDFAGGDVSTATWTPLEMTFGNKGKSNEVTLDFSSYAGKSVVVAFKYTSSEEVQSTFEIISFSLKEKETQDPNAKGTETNPYTCADLLAMTLTSSSTEKGYVIGYIVGSVDGSMNKATFSTENASSSNVIIAASPTETDYTQCIPVKGTTTTKTKIYLNSDNNPSALGKKVILYGTLKLYFGVSGINTATYVELYPDENSDPETAGTKPTN